LRELFFGGARFIMKDATDEIIDKQCTVKFEFSEPRESYMIAGKFVKLEVAAGRPDLAVLTVEYGDSVPMTYKTRLCSYVSALRPVAAKPAAAPAAAVEASASEDAEKPADGAAAEGAVQAEGSDGKNIPAAAKLAETGGK
jgi:hypothetical protein